MYVCIYIYIYISVYVYIYIYTYVCVYIYIYIYIYICKHIRPASVGKRLRSHTPLPAHVFVCVCVCVCVCVFCSPWAGIGGNVSSLDQTSRHPRCRHLFSQPRFTMTSNSSNSGYWADRFIATRVCVCVCVSFQVLNIYSSPLAHEGVITRGVMRGTG